MADGWIRQLSKKPLASPKAAYESFKSYLAIEKKAGKLNPEFIEQIEQIKFQKA